MAGTYLNRTCPICERLLSEEAYDDAYSEIYEAFQELEPASLDLSAKIEKLEKMLSLLSFPLFAPFRFFLKRKMDNLRNQSEFLEEQLSSTKRKSTLFALSRYYTSEWFQRTHALLRQNGDFRYAINVFYDKKGVWKIKPLNKLAASIVAEFRVFQQLLKRVKDTQSPLYKAQIVPNIYLPILQRRGSQSFWTQIDCLLLTKFGAFVIEVKRQNRHIIALKPFEQIWSTDDHSLARMISEQSRSAPLPMHQLVSESRALGQNSNHAVAFDEICSNYPFKRIYEQIVYVAPKSLITNCREFTGNVNVSCLDSNGPSFERTIENQCKSLKAFIGQETVDELGESYLAKYGDLDQQRGKIHARSLSRIYS